MIEKVYFMTFGLWLKKKAAINVISPDFEWNIKGSRTKTFKTTVKRNSDLYKYRNRV